MFNTETVRSFQDKLSEAAIERMLLVTALVEMASGRDMPPLLSDPLSHERFADKTEQQVRELLARRPAEAGYSCPKYGDSVVYSTAYKHASGLDVYISLATGAVGTVVSFGACDKNNVGAFEPDGKGEDYIGSRLTCGVLVRFKNSVGQASEWFLPLECVRPA